MLMEQFLEEVRAYAEAVGLSPSTVVQRASKLGGGHWKRWVSGQSSPNLRTVDQIRAWMSEHPADEDADAVAPIREAS